MVPKFTVLCACVYDLEQHSHLNNSCPFCFLFCFVLLFKIEKKYKNALLFSAGIAE